MEKKREGDREAAGEVFLSSDPLYHCFFGIGDEKGELKLLLLRPVARPRRDTRIVAASFPRRVPGRSSQSDLECERRRPYDVQFHIPNFIFLYSTLHTSASRTSCSLSQLQVQLQWHTLFCSCSSRTCRTILHAANTPARRCRPPSEEPAEQHEGAPIRSAARQGSTSAASVLSRALCAS
jgi:hypothetical protein